MKNLFCFLLTVAASFLGGCASTNNKQPLKIYDTSLKASYESKQSSSLTLTLHCASDETCILESVFSDGGKLRVNKMEYPNVKPLHNLAKVQFAYQYAKEHRTDPSATAHDKALLKQLAPMFKEDQQLESCFDLDAKQPNYMVVCKLTRSPWNKPTVIFYGTLLTDNCGAFCRYEFFPMFGREE